MEAEDDDDDEEATSYNGTSLPTKSSRRSQRRRRRRAEGSPTKVAPAPTPAPQSVVASDASTTSGSPGNTSSASPQWSEDDSAVAENCSRRTSGDSSNCGAVALMGQKAPLTGPLLSTIGTGPAPPACRNVVTWNDLLGGAAKAGGAKSHGTSANIDAGRRTSPAQPPFGTSPPPIMATTQLLPWACSAQDPWASSWAALQGVVWEPSPPAHWAGQASSGRLNGVPAYHNEDALRSWLSTSGLPSGQVLAAELQAVAPEAYED